MFFHRYLQIYADDRIRSNSILRIDPLIKNLGQPGIRVVKYQILKHSHRFIIPYQNRILQALVKKANHLYLFSHSYVYVPELRHTSANAGIQLAVFHGRNVINSFPVLSGSLPSQR